MKSHLWIVVAGLGLALAGCGGGGSTDPVLEASTAGAAREAAAPPPADSSALTAERARAAIESCEQFSATATEIKILEGQVQTGVDKGLWTFSKRKNRQGKIVVNIDLTPEGRKHFSSAVYYWGGVIPLTLAEPIRREVTDITGIKEAQVDSVRTVSFRWRYANAPEVAKWFKPELRERQFDGTAVLRLSEDGWRVMGPLKGITADL